MNQKNQSNKRILLKRETIKNLDRRELGEAAGGSRISVYVTISAVVTQKSMSATLA